MRLCKPEPPASSSLPRQALSPLGLQDGPCEIPSPQPASEIIQLIMPPPTPAIYTDPHTLSWPAPLTPAEHDLLPITGAQEGSCQGAAPGGSWLCACMCVCACTCVSLCACVHACVRTCVCLSLYVCVCACACVHVCWGMAPHSSSQNPFPSSSETASPE